MSEAGVHFEFYRHLENAIHNSPNRGRITYSSVRPEYGDNIQGFADLVLFDDKGDPVLVIEAKRPDGSNVRTIDPYSPHVIRQAHDYASQLGAPYFATYNGDRLVLFRTFEEGRQLLQRSTKSYDISGTEKFADTILDEISRLAAREASWDSLDNAFIERVRSLHEQVVPELQDSLSEHVEADDGFRSAFVDWASAQGIDYDDADPDGRRDVHHNFAVQAGYLLINKIIFYKLLESSPTYSEKIRPLSVSIHQVRQDLQDHFEELVTNVDFEAIFEHDEIYSEIPLDRVSDRIREFIIELDDQDLTQFDSDVIGRIYEGVIPPDRRHDLGEYYTPPAITDLITRLTVDDANDTVLDPACGSGGFLVSAYHRKQELFPEPKGSHSVILDQLYGIDINRFPAHLTAINLAIQDLSSYTEDVNIEISDFFDLTPDTLRFGRVRGSPSGDDSEGGLAPDIGGFDVVVGNPPYIRSRNMDSKDRIRQHLSSFDTDISRRMDIYGYFITHSTQFLREGGRLGFIISDRWLDTGYGADLQEFLLNNYKIEAVLKFDRQTFEDALIGSSIVVLTKCEDPEQRDNNTTKFLRIRAEQDVDDVLSILDQEVPPNQFINDPEYRLVTRRQGTLYENNKWNVYFLAPPIYFDLITNDYTIELDNVAEVTWGIKTGANDFFYGRGEEWDDLGLTDWTTPLLKASGQLSKIRFTNEDATEWGVLDLHDIVQKARDELNQKKFEVDNLKEESLSEKVKEFFVEEGMETLVEYIEWGEDQGYHDRATTSARDIWFDLGDFDIAPILTTDFTWRIFRSVWNEAGAAADGQFYLINPDDDIDDKVLCGILNSRIAWLMVELRGRWAGGQGMTRARIKVYETEELPIPDPRIMSEAEKAEIKEVFESLMELEESLDEEERTVENTEDKRHELDKCVLSAIGMDDRVVEIRKAVEELIALREQDAGNRTQVLINRPPEKEVIELAGVSEARESTTLNDFG